MRFVILVRRSGWDEPMELCSVESPAALAAIIEVLADPSVRDIEEVRIQFRAVL